MLSAITAKKTSKSSSHVNQGVTYNVRKFSKAENVRALIVEM